MAKIADDLYCGGNTQQELYQNFTKVLQTLHRCNLSLSASKTCICPRSTTLLGWVWTQGTLQASPHCIASLSTCLRPENITGLRSFIGAYKDLSRVLPHCSSILAPLEDIASGGSSHDKIIWSDETSLSFQKAQNFLKSHRSIHLPCCEDQLWIVTDGAVREPGIGATLYALRDGKLLLAGFFSAKLRQHQLKWLPCEVEALSIAVATKHFSPYIIQSKHQACILTDNKPCVQAFEKLCRGEFSASPRVYTFLSTVSRYQASIQHVAGAAILPSDFASRHAPVCEEPTCQICSFVNQAEIAAVRPVNITEVFSGSSKLLFTNRSPWHTIQAECADLRRTKAHLKQGTRPSKKITNAKDVKRYLNTVTLAKDGLLVVKHNTPFNPSTERIVIPREILDGFVMSLHLQLDHPSTHQLKTVMHRYFFALDMDSTVARMTEHCH